MRAVEAWLSSDVPERFAEAAIKCQHAGGFCMDDGFCHFDGQCFRSDWAAMTAACRAIDRAAEGEPEDVRREMRMAAALLRRSSDAAATIRSGA